MEIHTTADSAATTRHARFGQLPERIRFEDMVEEKQATAHDPAMHTHNPEGSWVSYSCIALDLGL